MQAAGINHAVGNDGAEKISAPSKIFVGGTVEKLGVPSDEGVGELLGLSANLFWMRKSFLFSETLILNFGAFMYVIR